MTIAVRLLLAFTAGLALVSLVVGAVVLDDALRMPPGAVRRYGVIMSSLCLSAGTACAAVAAWLYLNT